MLISTTEYLVTGWIAEILLCATIWSTIVSAQIDTGEDSDPTGDDSAGTGDPTGDDADDPTGDDDPPAPAPATPPASSQQPQQPPIANASPPPLPAASPTDVNDAISSVAGTSAPYPSSTPTLPSITANDVNNQSSNSSNGGAIAGGIFGVLGGLAILGAIVFFCIRKKQQQNDGMMTGRAAGALPTSTGPHQQLSNNDDLEVFRPQNEEMVGFHAWNAASSSDMLAYSAAHNAPAPPAPPHQYMPGYNTHSPNSR